MPRGGARPGAGRKRKTLLMLVNDGTFNASKSNHRERLRTCDSLMQQAGVRPRFGGARAGAACVPGDDDARNAESVVGVGVGPPVWPAGGGTDRPADRPLRRATHGTRRPVARAPNVDLRTVPGLGAAGVVRRDEQRPSARALKNVATNTVTSSVALNALWTWPGRDRRTRYRQGTHAQRSRQRRRRSARRRRR
jgi:hypothetical protein